MVRLEPKLLVRLYRIQSGILQLVGLQLRHQPDTTAFLLLVNEDARTFPRDQRQRHFQLLPAIATKRAKNIAGQTLRMDAHQRRGGVDITDYEGYSLFRL